MAGLVWLWNQGTTATTHSRSAALDASAAVASAGLLEHHRAGALAGTATIAADGIVQGDHQRSAALDATATIAVSGSGEAPPADTQVHNLVATALSNSTISLSWDDVSILTGEVFDIERDGVIVLSDYAGTHSVGSPYTDSGLDPGTLYTYRVRAVL